MERQGMKVRNDTDHASEVIAFVVCDYSQVVLLPLLGELIRLIHIHR
jgi:hypothetical protein